MIYVGFFYHILIKDISISFVFCN